MDSIAQRLMAVEKNVAAAAGRCARDFADVKIVAVSKGRSFDEIREAYDAGNRIFGENRVQEAETKWPLMPAEAELHMVGPVQKNKAKKAVEMFSLIHSVDGTDLAKKLNACAEEEQKVLRVLAQINVSGETSKHGFSMQAAPKAIEDIAGLEWLELAGLMTMAPLNADAQKARPVFAKLRKLQDDMQAIGHALPELSMGMSQDYAIAIEEGATIIRVGSAIFGEAKRKTAAERLQELETEA